MLCDNVRPRDCISRFANISFIKHEVKCSRILKMYEDLCHEQRKEEFYVKKLMKNIQSDMYINGEQHSVYKHVRRCIQKSQDNAHNTQVACSSQVSR